MEMLTLSIHILMSYDMTWQSLKMQIPLFITSFCKSVMIWTPGTVSIIVICCNVMDYVDLNSQQSLDVEQ